MLAAIRRRSPAISAVRTVAVNGIAVLALFLAGASAPAITVFLVIVVDLLVITAVLGARLAPSPGLRVLGAYGAARLLLAAAAGVSILTEPELTSWFAAASALTVLLVTLEPSFQRIWRRSFRTTYNLPGVSGPSAGFRRGGFLVAGTMLSTLLLSAASTSTGVLRDTLAVTGAAAVFAGAGAAALSAARALRRRGSQDAEITAAIERLAPQVMVYLSGPRGTEYQLRMWLPYLERLDRQVLVVVRESALAGAVARLTDLPVLACRSLGELDSVHVPSIRVALYVNNGAKNTHNVRYSGITHVQLLHGDSDKPASYNPVTIMFDKIFVAGQAGIDRYAKHGVDIPRDRFEIVGRPQVADIARIPEGPTSPPSTVLYAPTWTGFQASTNYGSLPIGLAVVQALVSHGATVVFRPHPFSLRDAASVSEIEKIEAYLAADAQANGRTHLFGESASATLSLTECFNMADALVSDVSSVPADFLYSEKPFAITHMGEEPTAEFVEQFPLARAAYVIRADEPASVDHAVSMMWLDDGLRSTRRALRSYYLGDLPVDGYADVFVEAVRRLADVEASVVPQLIGADEPRDDGESDSIE